MIAYGFILLFMGSALAMVVSPGWSSQLRVLSLVPILTTFVLLYLFVGEEIAQDRVEYYRWYIESGRLLKNPEARDFLFTYILSIVPPGLSRYEFWVVFSTFIFLGFIFVLWIFSRRGLIAVGSIPVIALACMADRLFLDMTLASSRSSLAGLLFILSIVPKSWVWTALLWLASFGMHGRMFMLLLGVYAISLVLRFLPKARFFLFALAILAFGLRFLTGAPLLPELEFLDSLVSSSESQSVTRGLVGTRDLPLTLAVQVAIAVVLPSILAFKLIRSDPAGVYGFTPAGGLQDRIFGFGLTGAILCLSIYPDMALLQRLFIVSIICLMASVPSRYMPWVAVLKVCVIGLVLPSHMA